MTDVSAETAPTGGAQGPIVVVGAGHAGVGLVDALRREGSSHEIVLVSGEDELPYERPPLSKAYLSESRDVEAIRFHVESHYQANGIKLRLGVRVVNIDPIDDVVHLADGTSLEFGTLVLATGGTPRRIAVPGADLTGVLSLATRSDADELHALLAAARNPVMVGAGFIGLEVAAFAAGLGLSPVVVDIGGRVLRRVASPALSEHVERVHREAGVEFELGSGVAGMLGRDGCVAGVVLSDGREIPADLVLLGCGMVPNVALAAEAGIAAEDGVLVDRTLSTSRPRVYAIGDCARFLTADGSALRIESIQNAADHAKTLARTLVGSPRPYDEVPWFWSDQGAMKLQIAGLPRPAEHAVVRGDRASGRFTTFWYTGESLVYSESVNHAAGHMATRRLLAAGACPPPDQMADQAVDLKSLVAASRSVPVRHLEDTGTPA